MHHHHFLLCLYSTGIMTAKLLPALLKCFHDNYVSVRMEVCIACNNLKITDEQVVEKLVFLATYDPIWKIKALALQGKPSFCMHVVVYSKMRLNTLILRLIYF